MLEETATCKYALLFTGDMNEKLNELLKAFIGEFESKFRKSLQEFNGNVSIFNFAKEVMENVFKMKTQHVEKPAGQGTGALKQPDVVAKEPFHLYCAACEQWFIKQANAMVHGTESCTKCHQPLFFVPKCDNCGHALIKHVREFNDFKANPQNCERCGAKLRIQ